jgi:hypothetical protein
MPLLKFGEWTPDTADYESSTVYSIQNVVPRGDGYGPFQSFASATQSLPSACRGAFYALKSDGSVQLFAATSTKLYTLNNTSFSWTDVSRGASTYGSLAANAQWQFAQTGNLVFATQANDVLQVFTLGSSSAFSNALGSPPQASYISVVGRFLVLSGLLSSPYRIQWSGLADFNSSTSWTAGTNSSDFQDFPDGGIVRGVAGGEFGTVFQDQAIRRMSYIPGSTIIFQIERLTQDMGVFAPLSIVRAGPSIFFYAGQGFFRIDPGGLPQPIGREKVDRTFIKDLDTTNLQMFIGVSDPRGTRVYWAYKSGAGAVNTYDKILGYDTVLNRFFSVAVSGQYLVGISQPGITLEALDAVAPTPLTVTGAANNGSGAVRLTLSAESAGAPPYNGFQLAGQPTITVYGVAGTTEANGVWKFTIVDATHIDLIGSTFTNAYVSGGSVGGSLDAMTLPFDNYATSVQPQIAQFSTTAALGYFTGAALEATIQTGEQGTDGQRIMVNGFRPITDAASVYGSCSLRENQQQAAVSNNEIAVNSRTGKCDMRQSTRYSRFKIRIPAGTAWTFASGVEPDTSEDGEV